MRLMVLFLLLQLAAQHHANVAPMSLEQIEAVAMESNPEIQTMQQRMAAAKAGLIPALSIDDPNFMYRDWGTPLTQPWNVNQAQHMFVYSQTIPGSGKRELRYLAASQAVAVAEAEVASKRLEISLKIRDGFYHLLRNYDELRLHDEQIRLAEQAVAEARTRYTAGRVPQQDVLKAQVGLTKLSEHLIMFLQDGDLERARLNTLMRRDPATPLEVEGQYAAPTALPSISELQQIALQHRPELQAIEASIRQSETNVHLAERNYKPDLTVGAGYMLMPSGAANRNGYIAELSLNLPWLNRSKHEAEIREAQAQTNVRHSELETQRANIFQEIQEAFIRANSAAQLVQLYSDTLRPQSQATLRSASAAYQTGQTDFLNLIDSQNTALDVEYSYYQALSEFDSRIADLERAIGTSFERQPVLPLEVTPLP